MSGDGVRIVPLPQSATTAPVIERLIAGAILRGRVLNTPNGATVNLQGANLPFATPDPPANGTPVEVRYNAQSGNVEIQPLASAASRPPSTPAPLSPLIQAVLNALPANTPHAVAQALVPAGIPLARADVEALVRLIQVRSSLGPDVARLAVMLDAATEVETLPPQTAATIREFARLSRAHTAEDFVELVRATQRGGRPLETLLAAWAASDTAADDRSLALDLARLRGDRSLRAVLSQLGRLTEFDSLIDGLAEHHRAAKLQALQGRDQSYQFLDVPVHPETGLKHLALHVFADGHRDGAADARNRPRTDRVVIDVSMSHLGNLWIELQRSDRQCACRIQADSPGAVKMLNEHRDRLTNALREVGFDSTVNAEPWQGDRLAELARAMDAASGLDARG